MAETEPQKKTAKPADRYAVQLVETEKQFEELEQYVKSETERLKESGYKRDPSKREHMPGLDMGSNITSFEEYREALDIARGVPPTDKERKERYEKINEECPQLMTRVFALVLRDKETKKIAGYAFQESIGYTAHQDMVYIPPEARKQGLFKVLISAMENTAREMKYPILQLKVENENVRGAMEKAGYQKDYGTFRMTKILEEQEPEPQQKKKAAPKEGKSEA